MASLSIDHDITPPSVADLETRVVRHGDLRPCYNAFVDTRTPGSEAKENFTIIGPGVSENPDQYVHIAEPHGFNIGGARQPPGCVNSQHSHDTAEVFVAHTGHWRFDLGETGEDAQVLLAPGDVISIPTRAFRGFTNVGDDTGFLWAVLGHDNPGRVTWAPQVFAMAKDYGLVLLESGRLVDTTRGEAVPDGARPMPATSADQVAALQRFDQEEAARLVWSPAEGHGEQPVIAPRAAFAWPHGFTMTRLALSPGEAGTDEVVAAPKVVFVHQGRLTLRWADRALTLDEGDTVSVPQQLAHRLEADGEAVAYIVRGGDVLPG